jgi:hypothetical protein
LNLKNLFESKSLNSIKIQNFDNQIAASSTNRDNILNINTTTTQPTKMKIIPSPTIRIADLFRCFLKNVPKNTENIEVCFIFIKNVRR